MKNSPYSDKSIGYILSSIIFIYSLFYLIYIDQGNMAGNAIIFFCIFIISFGISLFLPIAYRPLNLVWYFFGVIMARITNPMVLGFLYFFIITPIGLSRKLFGYCVISLSLKKSETSWVSSMQTKRSMNVYFKDQF